MKIPIVIILVISGYGVGSGANATQLVVIASNTKQFNPGAIIEASQPITLPAEATITLISSGGETLKLNGPFKGKPNPGSSTQDKSLIETLSEIATKEGASGLAVFRSSTPYPDLWVINAKKSNTYCVRDDKSAVLGRSRASVRSKLRIAPLSDPSKAVSMDWPGGDRIVDWPDSLPLVDGESYGVQFEGSNKEQQLKIRIIPREYVTDAHRAAWMWENGCSKQARRLVRALAKGS